MKPINQKDLELLIEIQENNAEILAKENIINTKIEQLVKEEE
jgi:hypothetical protein